MKIERVDDKTVKCFLSNEELDEYDIDYKDFVLRSDKAKVVVQDIIEQAAEEVGYKPPRFAFDLQIMMLPDQGLLLTFSEREPFDIKNGEQIIECLREMKEVLQKTREKVGLTEQVEKGGQTLPERKKDKEEEKPGQSRAAERPGFAVFCFDSIREVMGLALALPNNLRVCSTLYEMDGVYYLYLQRGGASYERYSRACIQALEFGRLYAAEKDKVLHLEEHGNCLIGQKALKRLRLE